MLFIYRPTPCVIKDQNERIVYIIFTKNNIKFEWETSERYININRTYEKHPGYVLLNSSFCVKDLLNVALFKKVQLPGDPSRQKTSSGGRTLGVTGVFVSPD